MLPVLQRAWKVAQVSDAPVLVQGETGTGKSVIARAIHLLDPKRASRPFVTVQCSTIQPSVAESELFGHARGAFSGAVDERKGLFRSADGGTVFLDDVGDTSPAIQTKLLDVLQRRVVRSVGSDREVPVDVRVIAATNVSLDSLVAQGSFRADLHYRLDVIRLRLPALRERLEDVADLVLDLAQRHAAIYGPITAVEPALVRRLQAQVFAGNVRELEHTVQRMLFAKQGGDVLCLADWPEDSPSAPSLARAYEDAVSPLWAAIRSGAVGYDEALHAVEQKLLAAALSSGGQTRRETASLLRMSERTLYKKLRSLRVEQRPPRGATDLQGSPPAQRVSPETVVTVPTYGTSRRELRTKD